LTGSFWRVRPRIGTRQGWVARRLFRSSKNIEIRSRLDPEGPPTEHWPARAWGRKWSSATRLTRAEMMGSIGSEPDRSPDGSLMQAPPRRRLHDRGLDLGSGRARIIRTSRPPPLRFPLASSRSPGPRSLAPPTPAGSDRGAHQPTRPPGAPSRCRRGPDTPPTPGRASPRAPRREPA